MIVYGDTPHKDLEHNYYKELVPWWMSLCLFACGWLGFEVISSLASIVVSGVYGISETTPDAIRFEASAVLMGISYGLLTIIMILITVFYKKGAIIKRFIKDFTNKNTWVWSIIGFGMLYGASFVISLITTMLYPSVSDNANQSGIVVLTNAYPFAMILISVILAPFCEEITYRLGLYNSLNRFNKYFALVITAIIFGMIHFDLSGVIGALRIGDTQYAINEVLNLPTYMAAGAVLAYVFQTSKSLTAPFLVHLYNNLLSCLVILFL